MYFDTAFDFDDLPEDDEPDATLPRSPDAEAAEQEVEGSGVQAPAEEVHRAGEESSPAVDEVREEAGPQRAAGPGERPWRAPAARPAADLGPTDFAGLVVNKHAEECFLIGPHGHYLDEHNGRLRMVEWSWACPWLLRSVGTVADQRYLISQRDLYLVVAGTGGQSFRLAAEPGKHGLWSLRPVEGDLSKCCLQSCHGTYLASLDDKDQSLYMSRNAEEWEQWRCVRVESAQDSAQAAPPPPEPVEPTEAPRAAEDVLLAFGLGDIDVSGLVRGCSPHLPLKPLKATQAAAKEAGGKDGPGSVSEKKEGALLSWDGPRANFQVREEVLPMCLEQEDMEVQDVIRIWEEWGCKFAARLRFGASPDSPVKWLRKGEAVPGHPTVVRLDGPGAVLDAVTVALRRNGRRLAEV